MKREVIISFILTFILVILPSVKAEVYFPDPAAVYCEELGYQYKVIKSKEGEAGICVFPDNSTCDTWEFFNGKCGKEFSICKRLGMNILTKDDGRSPFSREYAVCRGYVKNVGKVKAYMKELPVEEELVEIPVFKLLNLNVSKTMKKRHSTSLGKVTIKQQSTTPERYLQKREKANLPSSFDWRNVKGYNWLTPVKYQGSCGSCWAFAAVGAVESKTKIARNDPYFDIDLSEQDLVSCSDAGSCDGGWSHEALEYIQLQGITDEICFPYQASDVECSQKCSSYQRRLWKIDSYEILEYDSDYEIKQALVENGPLVTYINMEGYWDGDIYRCNSEDEVPEGIDRYHAIVLVGYDDVGGYWIAKNSWGTYFGENGYFKIGYHECCINDECFSSQYRGAPILVNLKTRFFDEIKVSGINVYTGSISGSIADTYSKDGSYLTFTESCSGISCDGLNSLTGFSLSTITKASKIEAIAYHRVRPDDPDFEHYLWNTNTEIWENLGPLPISEFSLIKYRICSSLNECQNYLTEGNIYFNYYHPSCDWCDADNIDIDWLQLEVYGYCSAYTQTADFEWVSQVTLSISGKTIGNKVSGSSTYSDFTEETFAFLDRNSTYTIKVRVNTTDEWVEYVKVWIDFNGDLEFSQNEEIDLGSATINGSYTFSGTFKVPENAELGKTRMRVYLKWNSPPSPCEVSDYGEVEDYTVEIIEDTSPPFVDIPLHGVGYTQPGETINITAWVWDNYGVASVYAEIESPDENVIATLQLFDDGQHHDNEANDGLYGNSWITKSEEKDYFIDIIAEDIHGNVEVYNNIDRFTTKPFLPSKKILLVIQDDKYSDFFSTALEENNFRFDIWDLDLRGSVDNETLSNYKVCIWSSPFSAPYENEFSTLKNYLENGGNLFITGQDIAWTLNFTEEGREFLENYLHAQFIQDNTGLFKLEGIEGDPISDNLIILISGEGGADNQFWPDEIDPILPAVTIFKYINSFSSSPLSISKSPKPYLEKKVSSEKRVASIQSSGSGAIRVDTGTYKVVFFAFGFEAINSSDQRALLVKRIIDWFVPPIQINLISPINGTVYAQTTIPLSLTLTQNAESIKYVIDDLAPQTLCTDCNSSATLLENLSEGLHSLSIIVEDDLERITTLNITFEIDLTPPTIHFIEPTPLNGSFINYNYVFVKVDASDPHIGNFTFYLNNINITTNQSAYNFTNLSDGLYEFYVEVCDIVGNCNQTEKRNVIIDTTRPVIQFIEPTPQNNSRNTNNNITIKVVFVEEHFKECILEWNGSNETMNVSNNICYITKITESGQNYTFKVFVSDLAGNVEVTEERMFRENFEPTTNLYIYPSKPHTFDNLTCENTDFIDLDNDTVTILSYDWFNGTSWINLNSKTLPFNYTKKGQKWVCRIIISDSFENVTIESNSTEILNSPPKINISTLNVTLNETETLNLLLNVSDPDFDEVNVTVNLNIGELVQITDKRWNFTWTPSIDDAGIYNLTFIASDGENSTEISVMVNVTNIPVYGNISDIESNVNITLNLNLSELKGLKKVEIINANDNATLVEFEFNFSHDTLDFTKIKVEKNEENESRGWIIVSGIKLPSNFTKTVWVEKKSKLGSVCIKDKEILNITEISKACNEVDEIFLICDNTTHGNYTCEDVGNYYKISGLKHSAVIEYAPYCGDGVCNGDETCQTCPEDCGPCPTPPQPSPGGGGAGGGGGGGGFIPPTTYEPNWSCTEWSECYPNGTQYRKRIDLNNCGSVEGKPEEVRNCTYGGNITKRQGMIEENVTENMTVVPECGNGVCESGEDQLNCCLDCGCPEGYKCEMNKCIEISQKEKDVTKHIPITGMLIRTLTSSLTAVIVGLGLIGCVILFFFKRRSSKK